MMTRFLIKFFLSLSLITVTVTTVNADKNDCTNAFHNNDYQTAFSFCSDASLYADVDAKFILAFIFDNGFGGIAKNEVLACRLYAELNRSNLCESSKKINRGIELFNEKNYLRSIELLRPFAEAKYHEAQLYLGFSYYYLDQIDKASEWLTKSSKNNNRNASELLSILKSLETKTTDEEHETNLIDNSKELASNSETKEVDKVAIEEVEPNICTIEFKGEDLSECEDLLNMHADSDYSALGRMFEKGNGVILSYKKAKFWYLQSALKGDLQGQYSLANFYYLGLSGKRDYQESIRWFLEAAKNGHTDSQYRLGALYYYGIPGEVQKDNDEAIRWLEMASLKGHKASGRILDEILRSDSPDEILKPKVITSDTLTQSFLAFFDKNILPHFSFLNLIFFLIIASIVNSIVNSINEKSKQKKKIKKAAEKARVEAVKKAEQDKRERAKKRIDDLAKKVAEEKAKKAAIKKAKKDFLERAKKKADEKAKQDAKDREDKKAKEKAAKEAEEKLKNEAEIKRAKKAYQLAQAKKLEKEKIDKEKIDKENIEKSESKRKAEIKRKLSELITEIKWQKAVFENIGIDSHWKLALRQIMDDFDSHELTDEEDSYNRLRKEFLIIKLKVDEEFKGVYPKGKSVEHDKFGSGVVLSYRRNSKDLLLKVKFKKGGIKEVVNTYLTPKITLINDLKKSQETKKSKPKNKPSLKPKFKSPSKKRFEIINFKVDSKKWLEWRSKGIDSNDAQLIYDKKEDNLFKSKKSKDLQVDSSKEDELLALKGREIYEKKVGIKTFPLLIQDKRFPWLQASLDGISEDFTKLLMVGFGEVSYKSAQKLKKESDQSMSFGEIVRAHHLLMITGLEEVDYLCYDSVRDKPPILITIKRDQKNIKQLYKLEKKVAEKLNEEETDNLNKQFTDILKDAGMKF